MSPPLVLCRISLWFTWWSSFGSRMKTCVTIEQNVWHTIKKKCMEIHFRVRTHSLSQYSESPPLAQHSENAYGSGISALLPHPIIWHLVVNALLIRITWLMCIKTKMKTWEYWVDASRFVLPVIQTVIIFTKVPRWTIEHFAVGVMINSLLGTAGMRNSYLALKLLNLSPPMDYSSFTMTI